MLVLDLDWPHIVMRDIFRGTVGNMAVDPIRMLPATLFYFIFVQCGRIAELTGRAE